jgi:cell division protein FtsB
LAAYIEATDDNGNIVRSLRYEEFIALNTWQIQKLKQRVSALEATIALLQNQ